MSSTPPEILDFESLLEPNLLNNSKILSYTTKYLTKPGDNYGSIMLNVIVEIKLKTDKTKILKLVAKMPPRNEFYWKVFQPELSVLAENSIYLDVKPILDQYQRDKSILHKEILDVFSKCYGARIALKNDEQNNNVDLNALLVLENLTANGYKVLPRMVGFGNKCTLLVLKNLAKFHAIPIAYRNECEQNFKNIILKNLKRFDINAELDENEYYSLYDKPLSDLKSLTDCVSEKDIENSKKLITLYREYMKNSNLCEDTSFTTIAHYDFWTNNIMIKYDKDNPVKIKIVDFQTAQYESLAHDVLFFLFTSVQDNDKYYERFLKYYYKEFIKSLQRVGCPIVQYSYEKFLEELKRVAPIQFAHILFMLKIIYMKKEVLPDNFDEMNIGLLNIENNVDEIYFKKLKDFIVLYKSMDYI